MARDITIVQEVAQLWHLHLIIDLNTKKHTLSKSSSIQIWQIHHSRAVITFLNVMHISVLRMYVTENVVLVPVPKYCGNTNSKTC